LEAIRTQAGLEAAKKSIMAMELKKKKEKKFINQPLTSFVNSAMNIELVYTILIGLSSFMDEQNMIQGQKEAKNRFN